ncbi:ras-related and estrogen-regulated growth inhibitor-like [Limulus polyphemus]|uniref:small monomeric GTPase n=1 Tax=Limulus polyphemus TaxID=6850 RepID=A0ABM1RZ33_LIMPO|nr:ras-related and estrogen-regulated growth inhibitor-like [Limulus polyphemus]XP_022236634.1 ras-related and estrogen-regulated growth inhibitor-like [Limulus polyphemus]XP_022236638.1 ras-related and estrogen-regulated growth inhibitor-like [Limulus polyphemus]
MHHQMTHEDNSGDTVASSIFPPRSPGGKSVFSRLSHHARPKTLKVMVLGLAGVGKSALTVRFITKRFIGDYDPTLEDVYTHETSVNNESVIFHILDSAGHSHDTEPFFLESNIRWADTFILMYSVTDKCSFDECNRLKFLINLYNKRCRILGTQLFPGHFTDVPVLLVGNKADQYGDRMISRAEGERRSHEIGCVGFHEISVRESIDDVERVFRDLYQNWKTWNKTSKMRRCSSDVGTGQSLKRLPIASKTPLMSFQEEKPFVKPVKNLPEQSIRPLNDSVPAKFRERACTDGTIQTSARWRFRTTRFHSAASSPLQTRRMSISMRGSESN